MGKVSADSNQDTEPVTQEQTVTSHVAITEDRFRGKGGGDKGEAVRKQKGGPGPRKAVARQLTMQQGILEEQNCLGNTAD